MKKDETMKCLEKMIEEKKKEIAALDEEIELLKKEKEIVDRNLCQKKPDT